MDPIWEPSGHWKVNMSSVQKFKSCKSGNSRVFFLFAVHFDFHPKVYGVSNCIST
jgi:hypothetical protein